MTLVRVLLATLVLSWPLHVHAAPPEGVSGIFAENKGGTVHVQWNAPQEGEDIASYRVYYSQESILQNGGQYDDFESTNGPVIEHDLTDAPNVNPLYISVLAVNSAGEESRFFLEEVSVNAEMSGTAIQTNVEPMDPVAPNGGDAPIAPDVTAQSTSLGLPPAQPSGSDFALLSVRASSATGVTIAFTHPISIDPALAARAFMILDAKNNQLPIVRIRMAESTIDLDTYPQEKGKAYSLVIGPAVSGLLPTGQLAALSPEGSKALFMGHETGLDAAEAIIPPDIANLHITAKAQGQSYNVTATWKNVGDAATVARYELKQSQDHGKTWSEAQALPANAESVIFRGVAAGDFSILVQAVSPTGHASQGITDSITLPPIRTSGALPASGMGAGLSLAMTGAIAGWKRLRRTK